MNKLVSALFAVAAFAGLAASPVVAQPAPKIVIVDMAKLLDGHYETEEQNAKLKGDEARANEELEKLNKEGQDLVNQFKTLEESSKNPALAVDAKEKISADMKAKYDEIQKKQNEVQSFRTNTQRSLQQRINNFRKIMFEKIGGTVTEVAKKKSANLVIDKSGVSSIGISPIVYSDASYDITDEVLKELNKGHTTTAPAAGADAPAAQGADAAKVNFPASK